MTLMLLCAAAFLAGFVDSVVGGGGLVQLPALLLLLPGADVVTLLGTNKLASLVGTSAAAAQYARHVRVDWRVILPAALAAFAASFSGARAVSVLHPTLLRPLILFLLVVVALWVFARKDFGATHAPRLNHRQQLAGGLAVGAALGFYDGFFGPGTGSFLLFAFVGLFGWSFLSASASAKAVNAATNLSAVLYFGATGHILYGVGLPMAVCNILGAFCGTRLAVLKGNGFVRLFFLGVVGAIILKLGWDTVAHR